LAVIPSGEAVGFLAVNGRTAAHWDRAGALTLLPVLPSPCQPGQPGCLREGASAATGLNDGAVISGQASLNDGAGSLSQRLKRWGLAAAGETLNTGAVTNSVLGQGVDALGRIWTVLTDGYGAGRRLAVFNANGTATDVATLGFPASFGAVNPQGTAVVTWAGNAYLATTQTGLTPLPRLSGANSCSAGGIAPGGAAVGICTVSDQARAVLWRSRIEVVDLTAVASTQGAVLASASGVSEEGEIVGLTADGRGYLLTPTPPAMAAQCGGGLPCRCGDTIVSDYTFTGHLACAVHGSEAALTIGSGVRVTGNNFQVLGVGEGVGLRFDGTQNSAVYQLHVNGFFNGVELTNGARGNWYHSGWLWGNRQHGVLMENGASANWLWAAVAVFNGVGGFTLYGVSGNVIVNSYAWSNQMSLLMLQADRTTVWTNGLYGNSGHAVWMDDGHLNSLMRNAVVCQGTGAVILIDSPDNEWMANQIECPVWRNEAVAGREMR
jgi:Periplasmic copper-binding protein (NosD)